MKIARNWVLRLTILIVMYVVYVSGVHFTTVYFEKLDNLNAQLEIKYNKLLERKIEEKNWDELASIVRGRIEFGQISLESGKAALKAPRFVDLLTNRYELTDPLVRYKEQ